MGVHTTAIVQLLKLRSQMTTHSWPGLNLGRVAGPRLLARQLLCKVPPLYKDLSTKALLGPHEFDRIIAHFVNETCELLYCHSRTTTSGVPEQSCPESLSGLLQRTETELDDQSTIPRLYELSVDLAKHYPFCTTPKVFVTNTVWVARDWILFHMARLRILDVLSDLSIQVQKDGRPCEGIQCSYLSGLSESCEFLLGTVPWVVGAITDDGNVANDRLCDTGLLIAQYPLWLVRDCTNAPRDAIEAAISTLEYIDRQRCILRTS